MKSLPARYTAHVKERWKGKNNMSQAERENILRSLNGGIQSKKLYPPGHPSATAPSKKVYNLLTMYLKSNSKLVVGIVDDALVIEDIPVVDADQDFPELTTTLKQKGLEAIIFKKGVSDAELPALFDILVDDIYLPQEQIEELLSKNGIKHIELKVVPQEHRGPLEVYNDALGTIKDVMSEIRLGKIPKSNEVRNITSEMADLVLTDTNAMVGLTMIKNYDDYLFNHSVNVSILSLSLGNFMKLKDEDMHYLGIASILHDVGKTGVSEDIIKKPGGLSADEWEKVKEHPVIGADITKRMEGLEELISRVIYEHHIKYDHSGYPQSEESLHQLSLIVCIADAYDALTTLRVYQKPRQPVDAIKIIKDLAGKHFDPDTAQSFEDMIGFYPVGTMVRLSTNEVGVVTKVTPSQNDRPIVKVLYDPEGQRASRTI